MAVEHLSDLCQSLFDHSLWSLDLLHCLRSDDSVNLGLKSFLAILQHSVRPIGDDSDREPGAEQKFKEISNAYEVLSEDEYYSLVINFKEAVFGVEKEIEVTRLESCGTCDGSGAKPGPKPYKCTTCAGQGQVVS